MADYDVGVTGLSVPPASAVVQQYRPAVSVRNNGVHSALATGYIRIYSAGQLIETFEVFSGSIPPGESRDAQTVEYWTPPATGRYLFNGYVTCDKDQVEPNNNLPPTYINVTAAPPPPTPPVTIHAAQHEEGGADEVNIDGLQGKTADLQDPTTHGNDAHAATYIVAADAEATVSRHDLDPAAHAANVGLERTSHRGTAGGYAPLGSDAKVPLANLPPISSGPHATTHENGGTDEISVAGLSGKLADAQDPTAHAASHGLTGGDPILSAEYTSRKGIAGGYCELTSPDAIIPESRLVSPGHTGGGPLDFLSSDRTWKTPAATVTFAAPVNVVAGFANTEGIAATVARSDHHHAASGLLVGLVQNAVIAAGGDAYVLTFDLPPVTQKLVLSLKHFATLKSLLNTINFDIKINVGNVNVHLYNLSLMANQNIPAMLDCDIILDPAAIHIASALSVRTTSPLNTQPTNVLNLYSQQAPAWNPAITNTIYIRVYNNGLGNETWTEMGSSAKLMKV